MIQSDALRLPGVAHAFFTREGGVSTGLYAALNGGLGSADDPDAVRENRRRMAARLGAAALVSVHQVHSADAVVVAAPWDPAVRPKADGMATRVPGLALGIATADCGPVLFADAEARVVGACHAGWRGALAGIIEATLGAMEGLGARRERTAAVLGPTIGPASYEVGPEFRDRFIAADPDHARFFGPAGRPGHARFDLPAFNLLYEKQRLLPDGPERMAAMNDAKRMLVAYAPYKFHAHRIWTDMVHPWVKAYHRNVFVRDFWRYVDIDAAELERHRTP